jgi:peroxiredoxin
VQVGERFPLEELGLSAGDGPVVVYFYSQAGTAGCTLEAQEFNRSGVVQERWAVDDISVHVQEVVERSTTPT